MKGIEIYQKIQENNKLIQNAMQINTFTLNNVVADLLEENRKLQNQCEHEYDEDGVACIYCMKLKED